MATTRITIGENFNKVSKFLIDNGAEKTLIDFVADRKAQHEKKIGNRKPTKTQVANDSLIEEIKDFMGDFQPHTISEIIKSVPSCADLSTPKVSSLVTKMKNAGDVVRTEVKGKAFFTLAD